ncbi:MAG TPA: hypothetical protein VGN34_08425 [Ktedonobacteraceae bacterium]|jgi:hypothetical protein
MMHIDSLDHLVLTVRDIEKTCAFYILLTLLLTACSTTATAPIKNPTTQATSVSVTPTLQPVAYSCQLQQTPVHIVSMGPEVHGKAYNSDLWALIMASTVPPRANTEVKIVWHMTGAGAFSLVALGPQGQHLSPGFGPEPHSGSNWHHPGDEWGSGFTFSEAGCWDIHASRDGAAGDVWLNISA